MRKFYYFIKKNVFIFFFLCISFGYAQISIPEISPVSDTVQIIFNQDNHHTTSSSYVLTQGPYKLLASESKKENGLVASISAQTLTSSSGKISIAINGKPESAKTTVLKLPIINEKNETIHIHKVVLSVLKIDEKAKNVMLNFGEEVKTSTTVSYSLSTGNESLGKVSVTKNGLTASIDATKLNSSGNITINIKGTPSSMTYTVIEVPIRNAQNLLIQNVEVPVSFFKITCPKDTIKAIAGKKMEDTFINVKYDMALSLEQQYYEIPAKVSDTINGLKAVIENQKLFSSTGNIKLKIEGTPVTNTQVPFTINKFDCKVFVQADAVLKIINASDTIKAKVKTPLKQITSVQYSLTGDSIKLKSSESAKVNGLTAYIDPILIKSPTGKINIRVEGTPEKKGLIVLKLPVKDTNDKEIQTCDILVNIEEKEGVPTFSKIVFEISMKEGEQINAYAKVPYHLDAKKFEIKASESEKINGLTASVDSMILNEGNGEIPVNISGTLSDKGQTLLSLPLKGKDEQVIYIVDITIYTTNFETVLQETNTEFTSVTVDKNNNVWVGTKYKGLYFLDQSEKKPVFIKKTLGNNLENYWIQSLAADTLGNLWVGHRGIDTGTPGEAWLGGVDRVNVNNLSDQRHFVPDRDTYKLYPYVQNDGLGSRNVRQIIVDPNHIVRVAHGYYDLTIGSSPGFPAEYIITPGSFASMSANNYINGKFTPVGTYHTQESGMSFPDNTYNPIITDKFGTRNVYSISADSNAIWMVVESFEFEKKPIPSRIMKYGFDNKHLASYNIGTLELSGELTSVYSNGKTVWVGSNTKEGKFSIISGNYYWLIDHRALIPENTKINTASIWGDKFNRTFIGTTNGLIVYNGTGDPSNPGSYKHYVNLSLYGPNAPKESTLTVNTSIISNNIITGVVDGKDPNYVWLVTDKGVVKAHIPIAEIYTYHVEDIHGDPEKPFKEIVNGKVNHTFLSRLKETDDNAGKGSREESIPSVTVDGTQSTVFTISGYNTAAFYKNQQLKLAIADAEGKLIDGDENSEEYIKKYGKFILKPSKFYNGKLEDLNYVDVIYQHPSFIDEKDLEEKKISKEYSLVFVNKDFPKEPLKTRYPIKFTLPPVLLVHGTWSDTKALDSIKIKLTDIGYDESMILKGWKTDYKDAEKSPEDMAYMIPGYIDSLKKAAITSKISAGKINVIAHSRGGLYVRGYIEDLFEKHPYRSDINSLITLNTPHSGTQLANAVVDQREISPKIKIPVIPEGEFIFKKVTYKDDAPIKVKDIFQMIPFMSENESKTLWGAKNMMVADDDISGAYKKGETDFIERLNSEENINKYNNAKVPFHAFTSTFDNDKKWYVNNTAFTHVSGKMFATYLLGRSMNAQKNGNSQKFLGYRTLINGLTIEIGKVGEITELKNNGTIPVKVVGTPQISGNLNLFINDAFCSLPVKDYQDSKKLILNCENLSNLDIIVGTDVNMTVQLGYDARDNSIKFTGYEKTINGLTIEVGKKGEIMNLTGKGNIPVTIKGKSYLAGDIDISVNDQSCLIIVRSSQTVQPGKLILDDTYLKKLVFETGTEVNVIGQIYYTVEGNPVKFTGYKKKENGLTIEVGTEGSLIKLEGNGNIPVKFTGTPLTTGNIKLTVDKQSCIITIKKGEPQSGDLTLDCSSLHKIDLAVNSKVNASIEMGYSLKKSTDSTDYVNILEDLYISETNDYVVPVSSMQAGISQKNISNFKDFMHIDLPDYKIKGITKSEKVQDKIPELLKQDINGDTNDFTKGISPKKLKYSFFPSFQIDKDKKNESKIVINPKSFISESTNLSSGDKVSFDVYQENIDQIILTIQYPDIEGIYTYTRNKFKSSDPVITDPDSLANKKLDIRNRFTFRIPEKFTSASKEFFVTAYGFLEGKMVAKHTIKPEIKKPENLLEKIRFSKSEVKMYEKGTYRFDLLGTFADGVERRINDRDSIINYQISKETIFKKSDKDNIEALKEGEATLTAYVGMLKAKLKVIVEGSTPLPQTKITDFSFARIPDKSIKLTWKTSVEYEADHFTLERSFDNKNFIEINSQKAKGTTNDPQVYTFTDVKISGHIFYRLKLYDNKGKLENTKVIEVPGLVLDCTNLDHLNIYVGDVLNTIEELKYKIAGSLSINFTGYKKTVNGVTIEVGTQGRVMELTEKGIIPVKISGIPSVSGIIPIEVVDEACSIIIQDIAQPGILTLDCNDLVNNNFLVGSAVNSNLQIGYTVNGNPLSFMGYKKTINGITIEVGTEGQTIQLNGNGNILVNIKGTPTTAGTIPIEINEKSCSIIVQNVPQPGSLTLDCNNLSNTNFIVGSAVNSNLQIGYTVNGNPLSFTGYKKTINGITIEVGTEGQTIQLNGNGNIPINIKGTPTTAGTIPIEINEQSCSVIVQDIPQPGTLALDCNNLSNVNFRVGTIINSNLQIGYTVNGNPLSFTGYKKTANGLTIEVGTEGQTIQLNGNGNIPVNIKGIPTTPGTIPIEINEQSCSVIIQNESTPKPGSLALSCDALTNITLATGTAINTTAQLQYFVNGNPVSFTGYKKTMNGLSIEVGTEGQTIQLYGNSTIPVNITGTPTSAGTIPIKINNRECELKISISKIVNEQIKIIPNPVTSSTGNVYLDSELEDDTATLIIYDINGQIVYTNNYIVTKGTQYLKFETPYTNGIYILHVKTKGFSKSFKLIVQK